MFLSYKERTHIKGKTVLSSFSTPYYLPIFKITGTCNQIKSFHWS